MHVNDTNVAIVRTYLASLPKVGEWAFQLVSHGTDLSKLSKADRSKAETLRKSLLSDTDKAVSLVLSNPHPAGYRGLTDTRLPSLAWFSATAVECGSLDTSALFAVCRQLDPYAECSPRGFTQRLAYINRWHVNATNPAGVADRNNPTRHTMETVRNPASLGYGSRSGGKSNRQTVKRTLTTTFGSLLSALTD
jgi:hypothetical protein